MSYFFVFFCLTVKTSYLNFVTIVVKCMSRELPSSHGPHMLSALLVSVGLTSCNSISIWKKL